MSRSIAFLQTHISFFQDEQNKSPVLEIYGNLLCGKPVYCILTGFEPYFYVETTLNEYSNEFLDDLLFSFNKNYVKATITKIERCLKQSILGYSEQKKTFLKLYFNSAVNFTNIKLFLENGLTVNQRKFKFKIYESNVSTVMRFMIDNDISGMSFVKLFKYEQIENDFCYAIKGHVKDIKPVKEYIKMPKLKIVSFDIECCGKDDSFPIAKDDPVIQIGNTICYTNSENIVQKDIFCLKSCSSIPGANVHSYETEVDLLQSWSTYIKKQDPDIIIGYNIKNFDFPYLLERAERLGIKDFAYLARKNIKIKAKDQFFSSRQIGSRASKDVEIEGRLIFDMFHVIRKDFNLRSYSLNSVSIHFLNEQKEDVAHSAMRMLQEGDEETRKRIASYCLKDTFLPMRLFYKLNVLANYSEMSRVTGVPIEYLSSRGQAIKVISQILRRARQEDYIIPTLDIFTNEQSFEGGYVMDPIKGFYSNPISVLDFSSLYPSIMIVNNLCYTTLLDNATAQKIIKENVTKSTVDKEVYGLFQDATLSQKIRCTPDFDANISEALDDSEDLEDKLNNAINQNKKKDKHYNSDSLSIDSIYDDKQKAKEAQHEYSLDTKTNLTRDEIIETPTKNYFVKKTVKLGLLPKILLELISERKKAKKELAQTDDPELKASLNARQNALKISANSVYGFTGATTGKLPCLEISQSVTSFGREMIASTKRLIEDNFNKKKGYSHNAKVIYGDTDSVMINFNENDMEKVFEMSKKISSFVSDQFIKPISLEFEKVYYPYLLMNKKRYAGLIYTNTKTPDKIDTKGIETVRRDNCEMVRNVIQTCLDLILFKKDVESAKNYVKDTVRDLFSNKIDLSQLVISKALTKTGEKYASKQAHVELAEKLKKRDENNAPVTGDRVGYVIVKGAKGSAAYERSEDPVYVLENNLPIDTEYYLENQLSKPIFRLFDPIMDNVSDLLKGMHTTNIVNNIPTKGPMALFARKQIVCLGCRKPGKILCDICINDYTKHYCAFQKELNVKKMIYAKCWTECQRCQGSIKNEVLCVNKDCPIFYMRTKVKKEINDAEEKNKQLKKLDW